MFMENRAMRVIDAMSEWLSGRAAKQPQTLQWSIACVFSFPGQGHDAPAIYGIYSKKKMPFPCVRWMPGDFMQTRSAYVFSLRT